ncbi:MAG: dihydrolipoyl dehydrogenase [Candidatus Omnitrophica bacterium]|nr:dihydrolipoyl dehydrogenase [Candidatus Omnitrophota bacterium]
MHDYDLSVIGGGWAGFNACLKAKEAKLKACLIEASRIGGTCLNSGCIPTKALIQSAKIYSLVKKSSGFGIELDNPRVNFAKIQERKERIVGQLAQGMISRLSGIDLVNSGARIVSPNEIEAGSRRITTKFIIIATGSSAVELPGFKFDPEKIINSDQALLLEEVPQSLLIIGGGFIGCEFAGLFSTLGSRVSIVEKCPQLLPGADKEVAKKIEIIFKKKGIKVNTDTDASALNLNDYSKILVCVGRVPNTRALGLVEAGIKTEKDRIVVNDYLQSNIPNIYAAGDCASSVMLAHYAAYQGRLAVDNIVKELSHKADNRVIPSCIFTDPEISRVGINEDEAKAGGLEVNVHRFDFLGSGMARLIDETEGFIKIISDAASGRILGASIIGPKASELIAIFTVAVSAQLKVSQMREMIFAHPTLAESVHEAL